ncbi:unnamed protein product [Ambrosiozyma monospora]|uniref:Unnamed protein product n=1 Tax=Ambrosiozyma monospora TaxID=43982 RepID=A0A9W6YVI3_AMBMO|nr:unnamed protein product [Ambrosiozyma monospora]
MAIRTVRYRDQQQDLLKAYITTQPECLEPAVIIEGANSTGKSYTLQRYLWTIRNDVLTFTIDCNSCVSKKELLQRILRYLANIYRIEMNESITSVINKCIGLSSFTESLKQIIQLNKNQNTPKRKPKPKKRGRKRKRQAEDEDEDMDEHMVDTDDQVSSKPIVIVLDSLDRVPINNDIGNICFALSRLHEQDRLFDNFSFVSIVTRSDILDLSTSGIPTITFTPYTPDQVISIISDSILQKKWIQLQANGTHMKESTMKTFIKTYVKLIYETYYSYFGTDIKLIMPVLQKLWPLFHNPLLEAKSTSGKKIDALSVFMKLKPYLTEISLVDQLDNSQSDIVKVIEQKMAESNNQKTLQNTTTTTTNSSIAREDLDHVNQLSTRTKYLIIAAYIASVNDPKFDMHFFTKHKDTRVKNRYKSANRRTKVVGSMAANSRFYCPQAFTLERLLAILSSISDSHDGVKLISDVELMSEVATLTTLKTLVRSRANDSIGGHAKWKCNVRWSIVKQLADEVGFEITNYIEQDGAIS